MGQEGIQIPKREFPKDSKEMDGTLKFWHPIKHPPDPALTCHKMALKIQDNILLNNDKQWFWVVKQNLLLFLRHKSLRDEIKSSSKFTVLYPYKIGEGVWGYFWKN